MKLTKEIKDAIVAFLIGQPRKRFETKEGILSLTDVKDYGPYDITYEYHSGNFSHLTYRTFDRDEFALTSFVEKGEVLAVQLGFDFIEKLVTSIVAGTTDKDYPTENPAEDK